MPRMFILGAGFSRYAGLPLGSELFAEVIGDARRSELYENVLKPDLDRYRHFKQRTVGVRTSESKVDLEEFISFLDVEHFLRFNGSDVYGDEGDRSQQLVKNLIARILLVRQQQMTQDLWAPYVKFASLLKPYDFVVSFNYDTIVETSLERAGVPYRLVPDRLQDVDFTGGTLRSPETEVVLLKMHGSIDWFDTAPWERSREYFSHSPYPIPDRHPIFGNPAPFSPAPIVEEPYPANSNLGRIRRIRNLERYFKTANLVIEAPLMLAPSKHKLLYSDPLKELWWGMNGAGSLMETVAIIGFSLPSHDQYAIQALYAIVRNFQHYETGELIKKGPLRFVDWCPSDLDQRRLQSRYRFVDWRKTELNAKGFRPDVLGFLFAQGSGAA